eukprot:scaffold158478_cov52-Attheya_sp.AAC.2
MEPKSKKKQKFEDGFMSVFKPLTAKMEKKEQEPSSKRRLQEDMISGVKGKDQKKKNVMMDFLSKLNDWLLRGEKDSLTAHRSSLALFCRIQYELHTNDAACYLKQPKAGSLALAQVWQEGMCPVAFIIS